ncbi:hypothetical protein PUMCH_004387 [Australozyma saopauloensis]|uniref:DNA-(apurinic or apyrimidinic site) endonuclease 2 n=1 Tax=Australozyma saopauloensis TaxID=291208 RepID=A0AAX4HF38_9ASCO|nr:hypothetical protein PUMCH_004387 [[Candida] saopauloensis]
MYISMDKKVQELRKQEPLNRIPAKKIDAVRYISFNVNSIKTLFNYHPWNLLTNGVDGLLSCMDGDIISLQELKVQPNGLQLVGVLNRYRAFVLVPKSKKGYSGVGLYVRIPEELDLPQVKQNLTVIKAEEGITGTLVDASSHKSYRDTTNSIGGYLSDADLSALDIDTVELSELDTEGRCSVIELANETVVFSLYCPANSTQTVDGQLFRIRFLQVLLKRCENLKALGKKVVIMGDINVSPDLIDNAEAINLLTKEKIIQNNIRDGGSEFEKTNLEVCIMFRSDATHRALLNQYLKPTLEGAPGLDSQFLYDTTRYYKKRQTSLYTVWNTQTNSRQSNYGSRIDLILVSNPEQIESVSNADILPYLYGSDHCPIFTDFDVSGENFCSIDLPKKLPFEAKNYFKLVGHRDISSLFSALSSKRGLPSQAIPDDVNKEKRKKTEQAPKLTYTSRKSSTKPQQNIGAFFVSKREPSPREPKFTKSSSQFNSQESDSEGHKINSIQSIAAILYSDPPLCLHGEPTILKTSYTPSTKGKKFWCCGRNSRGSATELGQHRCNFFSWATKKTSLQEGSS